MSQAKESRHRFYKALLAGLKFSWPIFSMLLGIIAGLGVVIAWVEGWRALDGMYFAFITGLSIGYGDFVPKQPLSRILAIVIGFHGVLLTALVAGVAVLAVKESASNTSPTESD